jgi:hypothetical protein
MSSDSTSGSSRKGKILMRIHVRLLLQTLQPLTKSAETGIDKSSGHFEHRLYPSRFVFWDVLPCKIIVDRRFRGTCYLHHQALMMEAARNSETCVSKYFTRQYIPEDKFELHTRRRENVKSHIDCSRLLLLSFKCFAHYSRVHDQNIYCAYLVSLPLILALKPVHFPPAKSFVPHMR